MKEDLIELLNSKKKSKDEQLISPVNDLKKYFLTFFDKISLKKDFNLSKIEDIDIISAFFVASNPLKVKEILNLIDKYKSLFDINKILPFLVFYFDGEQDLFKHKFDKCLNIKNNYFRLFKMSMLFSKFNISMDVIKTFNEFLECNPYAFEELKKIVGYYSINDGDKCVYFLRAKSIFNEFYEDEILKDSRLNSKQRRSLKKHFFSNKFKDNPLSESANEFYEYLHLKYNEVVNEYEQSEKERRRFNKNIEDLIECLNNAQEISNIDGILKLSPDEECTKLIVDYIIFHNKKIYSELVNDYEKSVVNSDDNLRSLFNSYGFSYEKIESKELVKLKKISYESIQSLLSKLANLSLNDIDITKVCLYKLDTISNLITKGIITKEWLKVNFEIILINNNDFYLVLSNLNLLSEDGINMILYNNSLDILRSSLLEYNINLLKSYNLVINKNTSDLSFLSDINLRERIEFVISSLLYQSSGSLDVLNYSLEYAYKLKISNMLDIPVQLVDIEENLLYDYSKVIIPLCLQEKLNSDIEFDIFYPIMLDKYMVDKYTLDINGIIVSKEKVRRNLAKIGNNNNLSVFYAIIYKGYYTYEEIEILKETFLEKEYSDLHLLKSL